MDARGRLTRLLARTYNDPDLFNSAVLGRPPYWSRQREIAESVCNYRITVAYTGNAIGKDYVVGGIVPWWLATRSESLCIVTGPSQTLLGSVTWKEIRRACERSVIPLGMDVSQGIKASPLRLKMRGDWGALGYSTTSVERASGQHNRKLLVICEEASGIDDEIWDALDSLKYVRLLAIGNPIRAEGRFVQLIRQAEKDRSDRLPLHRAVNAIRVSSRESPDAEVDESPRGLADRTWLADVERRYGKDSLYVRSHVDAIIPEVSSERLIPEAHLDWAASRPARPMLPLNHPQVARRRIACDLGEGVGRDSSAIVVRDDWGVLEVVWGSALGLEEAAHRIADLRRKWNVPDARISFDVLGVGKDMPLHLRRWKIEAAVPYAGSGTPRSSQYVNIRTEAAWALKRRLDPQGADDFTRPFDRRPDFAIPPGDYWQRLRDELKELTYDLAGKVGSPTRLLKKDDWAKALGHSPDLADALIQSFAFD